MGRLQQAAQTVEKEGIEKLDGQYQGWYMHVMGKTKPGKRQQQQQMQSQQQRQPSAPAKFPVQTSTAPNELPPPCPAPRCRSSTHRIPTLITDATKQAIYALAKEIFGEAGMTIAGLGWYVDAQSTRPQCRPTIQEPAPAEQRHRHARCAGKEQEGLARILDQRQGQRRRQRRRRQPTRRRSSARLPPHRPVAQLGDATHCNFLLTTAR